MCIFTSLGFLDRLDHGIDIIEGDLESFEDMSTCLCLSELVASTASDDLTSVLDKSLKHLTEIEQFWLHPTVRQSNHIV